LVHEEVIIRKIIRDTFPGKMKDIRVIKKVIYIIEGKD
jgi:hypothetical protein